VPASCRPETPTLSTTAPTTTATAPTTNRRPNRRRFVRADGDTDPVFLFESTGPARRDCSQLGRVDDITVIDDSDDSTDDDGDSDDDARTDGGFTFVGDDDSDDAAFDDARTDGGTDDSDETYTDEGILPVFGSDMSGPTASTGTRVDPEDPCGHTRIDRPTVTDGGFDGIDTIDTGDSTGDEYVVPVTRYTIDGTHTTTDVAVAAVASDNDRHVTARTTRHVVVPDDSTDDDGAELITDGGRDETRDTDPAATIAPNYADGGVWFALNDRRRLLLSTDDARRLADAVDDFVDDNPGVDSDDSTDADGLADRLRLLADGIDDAAAVEANPEAFDDVVLPDPDE